MRFLLPAAMAVALMTGSVAVLRSLGSSLGVGSKQDC
jgi:hypothetical protein